VDHALGRQHFLVTPAGQVETVDCVQVADTVAVLEIRVLLAQAAPLLRVILLAGGVVQGAAVVGEVELFHAVDCAGDREGLAAGGSDPPDLAATVVGWLLFPGAIVAASEVDPLSVTVPDRMAGAEAAEGQTQFTPAAEVDDPEVVLAAFLALAPAALHVGGVLAAG
jgi:hypothetical protein